MAVTGKTDLRLGRVPSRKVYKKLFADKDRATGGQKIGGQAEAVPPA